MSKTKRVRSVIVADIRTAVKDPAQLLLIFVLPVALLLLFSQLNGSNFASNLPIEEQESSLSTWVWMETVGTSMMQCLPDNATGPAEPCISGINFVPTMLAAGTMLVAFVRLSMQLSTDTISGAISRYAMTSLRLHEFFLGKTLSNFFLILLQLPFIAAAALAFNWKPQFTWQLAAGFVLACIIFTSLAFVVSGIARRATAVTAFCIFLFFFLCSSIFFDTLAFQAVPSLAFTELLREGFGYRIPPQWAWITLGAWAASTPVFAMKVFPWK